MDSFNYVSMAERSSETSNPRQAALSRITDKKGKAETVLRPLGNHKKTRWIPSHSSMQQPLLDQVTYRFRGI